MAVVNPVVVYLKNYFSLTDVQSEGISSLFELENLERDDFLLKSGYLCRKLSFVSSGIIRISALANDKDITQWIATEGYFAADLNSFITEVGSRFDMQAISDVEVYSLSQKNYRQICNTVENWAVIEKKFLLHCFTIMENRILDFISLSAEERYIKFFDSNKELCNLVPLQYIASMLGMTPETLSRIRRKNIS